MAISRRSALRILGTELLAAAAGNPLLRASAPSPQTTNSSPAPLGYSLTDVANGAGLNFKHFCGGDRTKKYILETTGSGVAFIDYDNDGWLDIFLVNGSKLDGFLAGEEPTNRLFRNNRDGTFTDVTEKAGLVHSGWGQGVCIGDYDNNGYEDIFVSYWGEDVLYHNNGDGTFADVTKTAGVGGLRGRWSTGCAFVDYDRDGRLDLFVSHYIKFDLKTALDPGSNPYCVFRGLDVNCGPRGLVGESCSLYHNNGDGTFTDVTEKSGVNRPSGYYGLGVLVADFDNDGWPDIYVANDDTPAILFRNNHDGTFTDTAVLAGCALDENGLTQSGMGVAAADYDQDGWLDIFKTNFSNQVPNLYRNTGKAMFENVTGTAGVGQHRNYVGWGCGFFDPDNDGWADIFYCNGHVYPELDRIESSARYREASVLYRNLRNGTFEDVSQLAGPAVTTPATGRGCAFGDFNNDGCMDIIINNQGSSPVLLRCDRKNGNHWITLKLVGVKSNRSAIGARVKCIAGNLKQIDEVRSGGSYLSQNDLRLHFGLASNSTVDLLEVQWPSGHVDTLRSLPADRFISLKEGGELRQLR
jgi:enediyne biosynthesis protein E4